jgi:hypothetical protein
MMHGQRNIKTNDLVVSNEETGGEVNDERTKYMVMSRDQKAGQNHNIKTVVSLRRCNGSNIWEQL